MVHVREDVFRADCIAGFGIAEEDKTLLLQVFLVGVQDPAEYIYDSIDELNTDRDAAIKEWEQDLKAI